MTTTLANSVYEIALNTFEVTCFMFPLEEWEIEAGELEYPDGTIRAVVRFDGAVEGGMVIAPSLGLLDAIAANMLGVDEATNEEKEGALCEIANIICGNTVPLFAQNKHICYIRPPRIAPPNENIDESFSGMNREEVKLYMEEGTAEIVLYYT